MSIRLSKACKELNIGMATVVDFLAKKGHKIEAMPNTKLSDDLYLLLAHEFNKDMVAKIESERLSRERQQKEKTETVALEGYEKKEKAQEPELIEELPKEQISIKKVGYIDLDAQKKKKPVTVKEEEPQIKEEPVQLIEPVKEETKEPEKEIKAEQLKEEKIQVEAVIVEEKEADLFLSEDKKSDREATVQEKSEDVVEKITVVEEEIPEKQGGVSEVEEIVVEKEVAEEEEIFTLKRPVLDKTPVVVGSIDLNLINQSTRPKPKTKEEKRKEREEKKRNTFDLKKPDANATENADQKKSKKKRERFTKQKVDITKVSESDPRKQKNAPKLKKEHHKKPLKTVVDEEEVQRQIKETLALLSGGNKKGKGVKYRRDKRENAQFKLQEQAKREQQEKNVLKLTEFVTVSELAVMMDVSVNEVIGVCMSLGIMVSINQRLDAETINIVAEEFGFKTEFVSHDVVEAIGDNKPDNEEDLQPRAPIVTVMGHVDHGKTSLLDYIRKTNVIAGEAGGITQHIGAYNVELESGQRITFLDTPGHEAFTAMRARGAKVTDIAIIIVAADDNVMPQTVEAINHASAANVPIVFAINKVDKSGANPDKIKEELANMNYLVEDWGGKYQSQDISAKQGTGVRELLEKVLLEAELLELKANPDKKAHGSIIESSLDKGRGYIATILVENGTLKQGDVVLAGTHFGKIKAMFNERNQRIQQAKPAEPALILGLNGAPQAGDNFNVMDTEQEARDIANKREQLQREQNLRTKKHFTLDELGRRIALGDFQELNIIVKGDVDGSVEALSDSLLKLSTKHIQVNVIHKAVGAISDSDVLLAAASNAIICGFQVRPTSSARKMAEKEEIDIRLYSIIYDAIEEIKSAMEGMLSPEIKEEITATVEVLEVFKISKVGTVAGCLVREGKINRNNKVRLIRDGIVVFTGEIDSLKRHKDDVKEVGTNFECGVSIKNYNDIKINDIIESFEETEVKQSL
jgi:translation initiation factor IF-2